MQLKIRVCVLSVIMNFKSQWYNLFQRNPKIMSLVILVIFAFINFSLVEGKSKLNPSKIESTGERLISHTEEINVQAPIHMAWEVFTREGSSIKFLKKRGMIPGVKNYELKNGAWDHVGACRIVNLEDGNHITEEIIQFDSNRYFESKLTNFTNFLKNDTEYSQGQWWFVSVEGGTQIKWTYSFKPKTQISKAILITGMNLFFKGYMVNSMNNIKNLIEAAQKESKDSKLKS